MARPLWRDTGHYDRELYITGREEVKVRSRLNRTVY